MPGGLHVLVSFERRGRCRRGATGRGGRESGWGRRVGKEGGFEVGVRAGGSERGRGRRMWRTRKARQRLVASCIVVV